jgi:hypothetical protein
VGEIDPSKTKMLIVSEIEELRGLMGLAKVR